MFQDDLCAPRSFSGALCLDCFPPSVVVEGARTDEHKQGDFAIAALRHRAPASQPFQRSLALFVSWDSLGLFFQFDPVDICLSLCYWTCWVQPKVWILKKKSQPRRKVEERIGSLCLSTGQRASQSWHVQRSLDPVTKSWLSGDGSVHPTLACCPPAELGLLNRQELGVRCSRLHHLRAFAPDQ